MLTSRVGPVVCSGYRMSENVPEKIIELNLGVDSDRSLFLRVTHAVEAAGGSIHHVYSGVAGSQEILIHEIDLWGAIMTMTSETGAPLVLKGPEQQVERLRQLVVVGNATLW